MAANPLTDVVMAASLIKATMPQQFKELCDAVRAMEANSLAELASAEGNEVFRAQGAFKIIRSLRKHLVECIELRATYQRRDTHGRSGAA